MWSWAWLLSSNSDLGRDIIFTVQGSDH